MRGKITIFFILTLAIAIGSLTLAQVPSVDEIYSEQGPFMAPMEPDPGVPDTITIETKSIPSGTTEFSLRVFLYNDEEIGGFNLPITWDSPDISCDSVSFVGSRIEYVNTKLFSIDNVNQRLQAGMIIFFEQFLQPGYGTVYTAYFTVAGGAPDQTIGLDSTFYPPGGNFALTLANGFNIVPQVVPGSVQMGTPANPEIALDPMNFTFNGVQGEADPPSQTLNVSNSGTGTLEWSLSNSQSWLGLDPMSGTNTGAVDVAVDLTGLMAGTYFDTIVVTGNADNSPQTAAVMLVVAEPPPAIHLDPTSIDVTAQQGSSLPPEEIAVTNVGGGTLNWSAMNISGWLSINPTSGTGDGIITADFDLSGLTAGVYVDTVTVTDGNASNSPQFTVVTLTVTPPPPTIQLDPTSIDVTADEGSTLPSEEIMVTNIGGGALNWSAAHAAGWLMISPTGGSGDGAITVDFDLTGLTPGVYYDTVFVSDPAATNSPQYAAVTLTVEAAPAMIQLDPTFIEVTAFENTTPASKQITVTNTGGGTLEWTAFNMMGWLSISPTSGSGDGIITLDFDLTGLAPDTYMDTVVVTDENAANSPQIAIVQLNVEAEAAPEIGLSATFFAFNATGGGSNPPAQMLTVSNLGGGELNWTLQKNEDWLMVDPMSGTGDGAVDISVDIAGLTQGTYVDTILVVDPAAANSPQAVGVTLTISDFAYGGATIYPSAQHIVRAYAVDPIMDKIYIGDFGSYGVGDIDPATMVVNGSVPVLSWSILGSHPDFDGEVMELVVGARPFILSYGVLYDTTVQEFTVSGLFTDQTIFDATGEVIFYAHISGDVNRDGVVNVGDPVFLVNFIFREGLGPDPYEIGDVNCDGRIDVGDVRFLINYVILDGPKPDCHQ